MAIKRLALKDFVIVDALELELEDLSLIHI